MLRSATKQTRRVLRRSRTIPRVAKSVRHHSTVVTEGAMGVLPKLAIMGLVVGVGGATAYVAQVPLDPAAEHLAVEMARYRSHNAMLMSDEWSAIAPSREAVLNKTYKSNRYLDLHKLLGMANNSKADQTTPVPKSVDDVIQFFIRWKNHHDNKTINSVDLRKYLGSRFRTFHDILTKIHDDEAREWDEADLNNLNEVVDFLDEISKMKMDR